MALSGEYTYTKPAEIESNSMKIIEAEMRDMGMECPHENMAIVKRVIHTTADFDYGHNLKFTEGAAKKGIESLKAGGTVIITDTNMALSGVNSTGLDKLDAKAICYMAREDIKELARSEGTTRAYASMKQGGIDHPRGIFAVGNAPTALIALSEMIREGFRPSLIIGVPVGFVNVVESKEEIFRLCSEEGIPAIVAFGRKGGSNVAAAICNALIYSAAGTVDPAKRNW